MTQEEEGARSEQGAIRGHLETTMTAMATMTMATTMTTTAIGDAISRLHREDPRLLWKTAKRGCHGELQCYASVGGGSF